MQSPYRLAVVVVLKGVSCHALAAQEAGEILCASLLKSASGAPSVPCCFENGRLDSGCSSALDLVKESLKAVALYSGVPGNCHLASLCLMR